MSGLQRWGRSGLLEGRERLDSALGGPARRRVVVTLASVLAVASADQGALGATADQIQRSFGISRTQLGLLGTITTGVSAAATLPFGIYVDHRTRTTLLGWSVAGWTVAMAASALAPTYLSLLLSRVLLSAVVAVAYPASASVIGDYFPPGERGRIYGYVITGELVGTGFGIILAGAASSVFGTWRAAMIALALPAVAVSRLALRLPEPARGGASRMPPGQPEILSAQKVAQGCTPVVPAPADAADASSAQDLARQEVRERRVPADPQLVLRGDPSKVRLWTAIAYVLRIRTNVTVIVASALGYFFFSGLRFFSLQFLEEHYGLGHLQSLLLILVLGVGAVCGALVAGGVADRMLRAHRLTARIVVPAGTFVLTAGLVAAGLVTPFLPLAVGLFFVAAFAFSASNPPLDAARLDIMPGRLWGRAESVRTVLRGGFEAAAPVTFGLVADDLFGGRNQRGLRDTFLVMLLPLLISGFILLLARRSYPRDVATAHASDQALLAGPPADGGM